MTSFSPGISATRFEFADAFPITTKGSGFYQAKFPLYFGNYRGSGHSNKYRSCALGLILGWLAAKLTSTAVSSGMMRRMRPPHTRHGPIWSLDTLFPHVPHPHQQILVTPMSALPQQFAFFTGM